MAASTNERGHQRPRFFDWLVNEIDSGKYEGLYWLDESHTTFRITWKHHARKSLVADDYKIFEAYAIFSGKHTGTSSKWKTNFRCALESTKRFTLVAEYKDPDPYRVYRILPLNTCTASTTNSSSDKTPFQGNGNDCEDDQVHISPYSDGLPALSQPIHQVQEEIDVVLGTLSLENPVPGPSGNPAENFGQSEDIIEWLMQQTRLNLNQQVSWAPPLAGDSDNLLGEASACEQGPAYTAPHFDQNGCLLIGNGVMNEPVQNSYYEVPSVGPAQTIPNLNSQPAATHLVHCTQQNAPVANQLNNVGETPYNYCFIGSIYTNEEPQGPGMMNNSARNDYQQPANQQAVCMPPVVPIPEEQFIPNTTPLQNNGTIPLHLDVSIYYRGALQHEAEVKVSSCILTYNHHTDSAPNGTQIIQFPSPETLPDQKQVKHTLTVLQSAHLLLYQRNKQICAKRMGKCKVFLAFSKQLDSMAHHPQFRLLPRNEDTEIFSYEKFDQELRDFHEGRRQSSPDYTIYLCFGQHFSAAKPKEKKLILVKLVPKLCKHYHEHVLREGVSSLNSESLELSHSLPEMMEYLSSLY
ncbi:interferon regulatory factor 7 isoform X2 [Hemicordylus capensis]|uniref:interferon regulatory factor 7 isoform X2 n=1 Tax=Hemicordylus capensis TaxID=884348 RepID=UPI002304AEC5|nr:interferon regulatory factor 7 isoform X2 [Hemicordylus capensis]